MTALRYIVCSNIRTGSNLFCRTLERMGGFGAPTELFHPHLMQRHGRSWADLSAYLAAERARAEAGSGAFGLKLHWYQFRDLRAVARRSGQRTPSDAGILFGQVPDARLIFLWRRDVAAQAVSAVVASMTGGWERASGVPEPETHRPPVRPGLLALVRVYDWEQFLISQNDAWRRFFAEHDLVHHEIVFEDLTADFHSVMTGAVAFLRGDEAPVPVPEMPTQPANSSLTAELLDRYRRAPKGVLAALCVIYRPYRVLRQSLGRLSRSLRASR